MKIKFTVTKEEMWQSVGVVCFHVSVCLHFLKRLTIAFYKRGK